MTEVIISFEKRRRGGPAAVDPEAPRLYPARATRQLALAHALRRRLDAGEFDDSAEMARALGFTRGRVSQLLDLLLLAPDIQEEILFLEFPAGRQPLNEADLRAIVRATLWPEQRRRWHALQLSRGLPVTRRARFSAPV
jgi:hypothetical protein